MFSILPCKDKQRTSHLPEDATLLIYKDGDTERGHIAYRRYMSAIEILSIETGENLNTDGTVSREMFLHADALIRAVGSIALNEGLLTLCSRDKSLAPLFEKFGFFINGDFYTLYISKLFSAGFSGCDGCNCCKKQ